MKPRLRALWPYGLFGAVTLLVFWDALFLGRTLHDTRTYRAHLGEPASERSWLHAHRPAADRGDTVLLLPMHFRIYNEGLKAGELRLWNPRLFGGYPLYYDTMLHPFYPPHLLLHLLFPPGAAYSLTLALHLFFAGAAMFWMLRGFDRSPPAAAAGGLIWMLWGYSATWFSTGILEGVSVFGPLALLGLHRAKPAPAGLAAGLAILGSHPQHALLLLVVLGIWSLVHRRKETPLFAAVALGVGMAAILTRLDSLAHGFRWVGQDTDLVYGRPWALLTHLAGLAVGKAWMPADPIVRSEFAATVGLAGTALAVTAALRGRRAPAVRLFAIAGAAALLVAFVRPLAELMLQVPLLNRSMPSRAVFVAGFCVAALAAFGWDEAAARPGRLPHAVAGAVGLLVLVWLLRPVRLSGPAVIETALGGALAVAAFLVGRARVPLGLAAILFDLLLPFLHQNAADAPLPPAPEAVQAAAGPWRALGGLRDPAAPPADPRPWNLSVGNNLLALHGASAFAGYEAILPAAYVDFALAAEGKVAGSGRVAAFDSFDSPLLDAASVRHLFMPFGLEPGGRWRLVRSWGPLRLYENPDALPRARAADRIVAARDAAEASRLLRTSASRGATILEGVPPGLQPAPASVEWIEETSDRLALRSKSPGPAIIVVSDTYDEGWEAEIDGRPAPILRADVLFRAVAVPAGEHRVVFRFRPESARNGLLVTALSILGVAAFAVRTFLASRRARGILPPAAAL